MYYLVWENEIIDEFETYKEADKMRDEYQLAFNGPVYLTQNVGE